ncbi:MAG: SRPBCC domain-containing protein [Gemmatimonadota bacterium]
MSTTRISRHIDATIQAEMTVSYTLRDAHGGTDIAAVHDGVPRGVSPQDNETGWSMSLGMVAKLLESRA